MTNCFKGKTILLLLVIFSFSLYAEVLDFGKKSSFDLGKGESLTLSLDFPKGNLFDFSTSVNKPFTLKKISATKIEISFDITLLNAKPVDTQAYSATFVFTKKNIGRKNYLNVKATYTPPVAAVKTPTATQPAAKVQPASPAKSTVDQVAQAQVQSAQTSQEMQNVANKAQEAAGKLETVNNAVTGVNTVAAVPETIRVAAPAVPQTESFPWLYIGIIAVLLIVVVLLLVKQMVPAHQPAAAKYEEFYKDIATILDVNIKGRSVDTCSEEIVHILMDKVQSSENPVALIKGNGGVEKVSLNMNSAKRDSFIENKNDKNPGQSTSITSKFVNPEYQSPFVSERFDLGTKAPSSTSTIKQREPIQPLKNRKSEVLELKSNLDFPSEQSTMSIDPKLINRLNKELPNKE